jgi:hypothetical protein
LSRKLRLIEKLLVEDGRESQSPAVITTGLKRVGGGIGAVNIEPALQERNENTPWATHRLQNRAVCLLRVCGCTKGGRQTKVSKGLHHLLEKPTYSIIELGRHGGSTCQRIWFEQPILPLRRPNSYLPMC